MWRYETEHHGHADLLSVVYHTLQLFILHAPHLEHPPNWQLHAGRLLSAVVVFWAIIRGIGVLFRTEWQLAWTRFRGGHVIICGLGRLGRQLAAQFRQGGNRVIVLESAGAIDAAATANFIILSADATDARELQRAGVARARQLIAVCDDVQTNVAVLTAAGEVLQQAARTGRQRHLEGWLFVPDARLRQLLKQDGLFPNTGPRYRINVRGLDLFSLAARQVLAVHPLDAEMIEEHSPTVVHLVIVGFGPMGQRLALQAAQLGHFANLQKPRITVLESDGSPRVASFLSRYPRLTDLVDFASRDFDDNEPDAAAKIQSAAERGGCNLTTTAICWDSCSDSVMGEAELFRRLQDDDAVNLRLALSLRHAAGAAPRVLLFQTRRSGFADLFGNRGQSELRDSRVYVFGTIEQTCSLDALLHEETDAIARALHEAWYATQIAGGRKPGEKPALRPWDQIDEMYRESNRHAADHIPVKMRAIGCRVDRLNSHRSRLTVFTPEQIELLAKMEHARWYAELALMGYSFGTGARDDQAKTHPDLVPWGKLADPSKDYDRRQVEAIPSALERAGLGVFPA